MTVIAFLCLLSFAICTIMHGIELRKIRAYLKQNHDEIFKKYSLDTASLMLGTDDVDWNFQKFILNKKYAEIPDEKLNELCKNCRNLGLTTYASGIVLLIIFVAAGVVGS